MRRVEFFGRACGLLIDLLQRLAHLCELHAAHGNLREHRAQGAALFFRGGNEALEVVSLLLRFAGTGKAFQGVEHVESLMTEVRLPTGRQRGYPATRLNSTAGYGYDGVRGRRGAAGGKYEQGSGE